MSRFTKELAGHLNHIRSQYIASHNQIHTDIEKAIENFRRFTGCKNVHLMSSTKKEISKKIFYMQRRAVISLENAVESFLYGSKNSHRIDDFYQKRFSKRVIEDLEQLFLSNPYPTEFERIHLAERHNLSFKQVTNWFTNKRNRSKSTDLMFYSGSRSNE